MAEIILSPEDIERFRGRLRLDTETGCLLWTAGTDQDGYGAFRALGGRQYKAHRVAWIIAGNKITPDKPCVLHNCPSGDNPSCCNPAHLWAGTNTENQKDKARKGRGARSAKGLPFGVNQLKNRFQAFVQVCGKQKYLGSFGTIAEAAAVAERARSERF